MPQVIHKDQLKGGICNCIMHASGMLYNWVSTTHRWVGVVCLVYVYIKYKLVLYICMLSTIISYKDDRNRKPPMSHSVQLGSSLTRRGLELTSCAMYYTPHSVTVAYLQICWLGLSPVLRYPTKAIYVEVLRHWIPAVGMHVGRCIYNYNVFVF